ncbi:integrase core domain-containing protein [Bradyrhizobium sp. SZCCHNS2005]
MAPGKPIQNASVERFSDWMRDELLNDIPRVAGRHLP